MGNVVSCEGNKYSILALTTFAVAVEGIESIEFYSVAHYIIQTTVKRAHTTSLLTAFLPENT